MAQLIDKSAGVAEIKDLYKDIDKCIGDLVLARSKHDKRGISDAHWKMETLMVNIQQVLSYILQHLEVKEIQEESVSEDLEDITQKITYEGEVYTRCYKDKLDEFACKYPISVPKPPKRYAKYSDTDLTIAVKEGAKWQKEHLLKLSDSNDLSESVSEDLEEVSKKYSSCIYLEEVLSDDDKEVLKERLINTFKAGAKWQKEQMMSKAIDFIIVDNNATSTEISTFPYVSLGTEGDTVKLIILKQD